MNCKDVTKHIKWDKYYSIDNQLDWLKAFQQQEFPLEFLETFFQEFIKFDVIHSMCKTQRLTEDFILKHLKDIKSKWKQFTWNVLIESQSTVFSISTLRKIADEFIEENKSAQDFYYSQFWKNLASFQVLNESFITDYEHYFKTYKTGAYLYHYQSLSNDFVQDKHPWIYNQYRKYAEFSLV